MMSLFSSFDALCAESSGWRLGLSDPVERPRSSLAPQDGFKISGEEVGKKCSATAPAPDKPSAKGMRRNPRFAVEMDGVHCFETIYPF